VNLDWLLARGHHLDLVASLIEGDLRKEVLFLLKRVSDQSGHLWASFGHCVASCVSVSVRAVSPCPFGPTFDLGVALSTSAIATSVPGKAPLTSARRHTRSFVYRLCKNADPGWFAVGFGVRPRDAATAFDQHGITKLVRAVAVLVECLGNL